MPTIKLNYYSRAKKKSIKYSRQLAKFYKANKYLKYYLIFLVVLIFTSAVFIINHIAFNQVYSKQIVSDEYNIFSDKAKLKKYLEKHGVDETIAKIKASPVDCHQYSHQIGHLNFELIGEKAFSISNSNCMSGYTHGVTEAFFKEHGTDNLAGSINLICRNQVNDFYAHQCFHGIGHGLMAYNDYDLPEALKGCDTLPEIFTSKESCYTGVFMENVVGALEVEEVKNLKDATNYHSSEWLSKDPLFPCNSSKIAKKYKSSCYNFQTSRMIVIFGNKYNKVAASCAKIQNIYQETCFLSMGRDVGSTYDNDSEKIETNCSYAKPNTAALSCIEGASQNSFWHESEQDNAIALCKNLKIVGYKKRCYSIISVRARDVIENENDISKFCGKFESRYKELCTTIQ